MSDKISGKRVFITGGAGFIGSRLVKSLVALDAAHVVIYDNLHSQVHGDSAVFETFDGSVECIQGAVEDKHAIEQAVLACNPDIIIHFAAETGTGQSLDEIIRYTNVNVMGTVNLLNAIDVLQPRSRDFLLASSRSVYGEGPHVCESGKTAQAETRDKTRMHQGDFNVYSKEGEPLSAVGMTHEALVDPKSVYASTKLMQEHLLLNVAHSKQISPKILRFQNVYGAGQSLKNPYTGVLSIFAGQILSGNSLNIFEDGEIIRDFVYVDDVVKACVAAINFDGEISQPIDIGSGEKKTILEMAKLLLKALGSPENQYYISGDFRDGDIRAAYADIKPAFETLDWKPQVSSQEGIQHLADWSKKEFTPLG